MMSRFISRKAEANFEYNHDHDAACCTLQNLGQISTNLGDPNGGLRV